MKILLCEREKADIMKSNKSSYLRGRRDSVKLIHCADLHLDSKLDTNLSPEQARQRGEELCHTTLRLVDYAKENGVAGVLLAGDLFDTQRVSRRTVELLLDAVQNAPQVTFFYLRGNHDEETLAIDREKLPPNVVTFSQRWQSWRLGSVVITGIEPQGNGWNTCYDELALSPEHCNIVMLHGQISASPGEELIALPRLAGKHIDYLALGHLHSYQTGLLDARGSYCYSGCLEGRGFDECGEKGFVLLETRDTGGIKSTFVPFAERTLHTVEVDVSRCATNPDCVREVQEQTREIPVEDLVKVVLTGGADPELPWNGAYLQRSLEVRFFYAKVEDATTLQVRAEDYVGDVSLKGAFVRLVLEREEAEEDRRDILRWGMEALRGEEVEL
jgi:DNA repair exonuclease SbcCD nuclease subunit